jgi:hypothetical protein
VFDAGADSAVDDVQLLLYDGRGDQQHTRDAIHRLIDARRRVEIAHEDVYSRLRQQGCLLGVADQDSDGFSSLGE